MSKKNHANTIDDQALLDSIQDAFENGKDVKRSIGLYSRVSENERFYRGNQWQGINTDGLPTPTFNMIRRIVNYLVSAVMGYRIDIRYENALLEAEDASETSRKSAAILDILSGYRERCWERQGIDRIYRQALTDAVLSGDGVFYVWYDKNMIGADGRSGDIRISVLDNVNLFASNMNVPDIQSQSYIMLCGRAEVAELRREALLYGCDKKSLSLIVPDEVDADHVGDMSVCENGDKASAKAEYVIRFSKNPDGYVVFEKCVRNLVIHREVTGLRRYPVAAFSWERAKNCFHGSSPISELIGNQKYVNKAFAMEMKHMTDTAFSKVIYDKRLIPEWSNEVGQAIGVMSGGDVSGAVTTVGVGEMQDGYIDIIDRVISYTKELAGATDTALGEVDPTNTSAIITLRETADLPLDNVRAEFCHCLEELAMIWIDMLREYMPQKRRVVCEGDVKMLDLDSKLLSAVTARAQTGASKRYSGSLLLSTLNTLLAGGHISITQYLRRLPEGIIPDREQLLDEITKHEKENMSNADSEQSDGDRKRDRGDGE